MEGNPEACGLEKLFSKHLKLLTGKKRHSLRHPGSAPVNTLNVPCALNVLCTINQQSFGYLHTDRREEGENGDARISYPLKVTVGKPVFVVSSTGDRILIIPNHK